MQLRFIGQNGSMGLKFGQLYRLSVQPWQNGVRIIQPIACPYASEQAFWQNWAHPREDLRALMEARGRALRELHFVREFETAPEMQCPREEIHGSHNWTGDPVFWCPGKTY